MENKKKVKTIFDHVIDSSVINTSQQINGQLPMHAVVIPKINQKNIDIETELKGINKPLSKCNKN